MKKLEQLLLCQGETISLPGFMIMGSICKLFNTLLRILKKYQMLQKFQSMYKTQGQNYIIKIVYNFLFFCSTQVMICSLLPRPKYSHLGDYYKKTSKRLYFLSKKYKCSKFIDFTSLFVNSNGYILEHLFCDGIHLSSAGVEKFASHLFGQIIQKQQVVVIYYLCHYLFSEQKSNQLSFVYLQEESKNTNSKTIEDRSGKLVKSHQGFWGVSRVVFLSTPPRNQHTHTPIMMSSITSVFHIPVVLKFLAQ